MAGSWIAAHAALLHARTLLRHGEGDAREDGAAILAAISR